MDPQPPPTAPPSATYAPPHEQHHVQRSSLASAPGDTEKWYNERNAHLRQQEPQSQRGSKNSNHSNARGHDSVISQPFSPKPSSPPSLRSSTSSTARKPRPIQDIHQAPVDLSYPSQAHLDPEKATASLHSAPSPNHVSASNPDATAVIYDSGEYHDKGPEEKPLQLLLYLSGPCALLSFFITIWTFFSLFIALLLRPFQLCSARPSLSAQLTTFLAPPLNLQLHLVYSFSSATNYSPSMLVAIHLLSPFVAIGVAIAAWTSAFFWFFSAILGDPAGQDSHNDGKDSILGVRNWWDRWLSRALR